jgi:hypothetical protein
MLDLLLCFNNSLLSRILCSKQLIHVYLTIVALSTNVYSLSSSSSVISLHGCPLCPPFYFCFELTRTQVGTILFVLKLIKNSVTELLEGPVVPASKRPASHRPHSGCEKSPAQTTNGRPRSVSRSRTTQVATLAHVEESERKDGAKNANAGDEMEWTAGKKEGMEEEEMDDATLEAAVLDLRTCMELVMKRLDIGADEKNNPPAPRFVLLHNQ